MALFGSGIMVKDRFSCSKCFKNAAQSDEPVNTVGNLI